MTKSISYINYNPLDKGKAFPYLWLSFQAYIQDNYSESNWVWNDALNFSECTLQTILDTKPALILTSLYTWNYDKLVKFLQDVKESLPNTIIVVGGPHQMYKVNPAWFKDHPYIDYVCREDGYGEVFLTELLRALDNNLSLDTVPFCIYPTENRLNYKESTSDFYKRDFKWPSKVFERFADKLDNNYTTIYYESSRGCPYRCTYCEWSGGTGAKVSFKPTELILEDVKFILDNFDLEAFEIIDANFGIIPRDVEIIQEIISRNPNLKVNVMGPTKTNSKYLLEIYRLLTSYGMLDTQTIAIQETNLEPLKNIKRKNLPIEDHISIHEALTKEFPNNHLAEFELILGLPGATLESFFDIFTLCNKYHMAYSRHIWKLLPTTPAARQDYVDKYKIKTLNIILPEDNTNYRFNEIGTEIPISSVDIVVETYSYTKAEWTSMYLIDCMAQSYYNSDILDTLTQYLGRDIIKDIYYDIIPNLGGIQTELFNILLNHTKNVVELETSKDLNRVDISSTKFKVQIAPSALFSLIVMINPANFFLTLHKVLDIKDSKLLDLCQYLIQRIKGIDSKDTLVSKYKWEDKAIFKDGLYIYNVVDSKTYTLQEYFSNIMTNYTGSKLEVLK